MIKDRFSTITCLLAICLCIIFSASLAYSYSGAQATCLRAEPAPNIDGTVAEGEWGEGLYLSKAVCLPGEPDYNGFGNVYTPDQITDESDISGTIYCLWDDQNLYLAAKITDDDVFLEKGTGMRMWHKPNRLSRTGWSASGPLMKSTSRVTPSKILWAATMELCKANPK